MKVAILTTDSREHYKTYDDPVPAFGTAPEALLQGFAGLPDVQVHVVCCAQQPLRSPEKLADNIWYHGLHVPKIGWMRTLYQGCIRASRQKLRELQPDIVHGQGTERDCAISAVLSGFPNVLTIHGNMRLVARVNGARAFSYPWLAGKLERLTIPRSSGVVCITNYTREAVKEIAKKTWVVPNGVDARFFDVAQDPVKADVPIILSVGAVCHRKNQNAFILAMAPLARTHKFKIVFLGQVTKGDAYDDEFLKLVEAHPWCSYQGFAGREELKKWLQRSSVVVLPSLEDNCPMVVLEAMAAGVAVSAANVGGVPDLVKNGENGLLFDPLNATSMQTAIAKFLDDPALRQRLAAEALVRAKCRFHPLAVAKQHVEIYREVLSARS